MKAILFLALFTFSLTSFALGLKKGEFDGLTPELQAQAIDAYREFLKAYSEKTEHGKFSSVRFSLFTEAWASGEFDCFYAGWPSRSTPKAGGGRLCSSPSNGNPDYPRRASGCGANSLLCQPAIFGSGLCVSVATREQRNSAFNQCEQRFAEAGRSTADVVREMSSPEARQDLDDLVENSERICRQGFQSGTIMCNRLREKISQVRAAAPSIETVAQTAVQVTSGPVEPEAEDCDPNTPGIQTRPPTVTTPARPVVTTPSRMQRIHCPATRPARMMTPEEQARYLRDNNMSVVYGTATPEQIQAVIDEHQLIPAPIRRDMVARGARIHLIAGDRVGLDPSWNVERDRAPEAQRVDWDNSAHLPGTGGFLGNPILPTRIALTRLEYNGSANLLLHEHAHTLNSSGHLHALSSSQQWRAALAQDSRATEFLRTICGSHCDRPEEAFCELFANYFACEETKNQMREFMPTISRLFDRMGSAQDLLAGRIDLTPPAETAPRTSTVPRTEGIIIRTRPSPDGVEIRTPRTPEVSESSQSGSLSGGERTGAQVRIPSGAGVVSTPSQETLTPSRALELVNSGNLTYHGRGLLPGSDTVGSCVFSNAEVYVIIHACRRDGREAPATNIDIITRDGQKLNFYVETSAAMETSAGLPSRLRREQYDRGWRITYSEPGPVPSPYSLESMRGYLERNRQAPACFISDMTGSSGTPSCLPGMEQARESFASGASGFHRDPGEGWYNFLRSMRQRAQASAGR